MARFAALTSTTALTLIALSAATVPGSAQAGSAQAGAAQVGAGAESAESSAAQSGVAQAGAGAESAESSAAQAGAETGSGVAQTEAGVAQTGATPARLASAPRPDTSDNTIKVVQHNPDGFGFRPAVRAAADWGGVDAITYQELCRGEVKRLRAAGYRVRWSRVHAKAPRCVEGNAVATPHRFAKTEVHRLLATHGRVFTLVCADLRGTGVAGTTVCTTHFPLDYNGKQPPTGRQNRIRAADKVSGIVNAKIAAGRRVVLAGDLNDTPRSTPLDRFYRAHGKGRLWEGDQRCGKRRVCRAMPVTTDGGRRVDYLFASSPGVNRLTGVTKRLLPRYDPSGHWVIRGTVRFGPID